MYYLIFQFKKPKTEDKIKQGKQKEVTNNYKNKNK